MFFELTDYLINLLFERHRVINSYMCMITFDLLDKTWRYDFMKDAEKEIIRKALADKGKHGLNLEQICNIHFPHHKLNRALKDRISAFLKDDPSIEAIGNTRNRRFRMTEDKFDENFSINEIKDSVYVCFELSSQGTDGWKEGNFRGNDFLLILKERYKKIHDSIYDQRNPPVNQKFFNKKWDEITDDLVKSSVPYHEWKSNKKIDYITDHWRTNPDWMKKKKITVEIPNSIDIVLDEIKILLKAETPKNQAAQEAKFYRLKREIESTDKLTRGEVINWALLYFYRALKSDIVLEPEFDKNGNRKQKRYE